MSTNNSNIYEMSTNSINIYEMSTNNNNIYAMSTNNSNMHAMSTNNSSPNTAVATTTGKINHRQQLIIPREHKDGRKFTARLTTETNN